MAVFASIEIGAAGRAPGGISGVEAAVAFGGLRSSVTGRAAELHASLTARLDPWRSASLAARGQALMAWT